MGAFAPVVEPGERTGKYRVQADFLLEGGPQRANITTGDAGVTEFADDSKFNRLQAEISRIVPAEVLIPENLEFNFLDNLHLTKAEPWKFEFTRSTQNIQSTFDVAVVDGLGLKNKNAAICAYGGLLDYLQETDPSVISYGNFPTIYSIDSTKQFTWNAPVFANQHL